MNIGKGGLKHSQIAPLTIVKEDIYCALSKVHVRKDARDAQDLLKEFMSRL